MLTAADHFGHRETNGIVVDLFWNRRNLKDEFRVEVEDRRKRARFVLYPTTGREAIHAFYHPFASGEARSSARPGRRDETRTWAASATQGAPDRPLDTSARNQ